MDSKQICETVHYIVNYGDKRLKKLVSRGNICYSVFAYNLAGLLPSIKEAIYRIEIGADDYPYDLPRLKKLYRTTCKKLYKAIKKATKEAK